MKNPFKKKVPTNDYILTFVKREKKKNMLCKEEREKVPLYGLTEEEYITILKLLRLLELKSGNNCILVPNSLSIRVVGDTLEIDKKSKKILGDKIKYMFPINSKK